MGQSLCSLCFKRTRLSKCDRCGCLICFQCRAIKTKPWSACTNCYKNFCDVCTDPSILKYNNIDDSNSTDGSIILNVPLCRI